VHAATGMQRNVARARTRILPRQGLQVKGWHVQVGKRTKRVAIRKHGDRVDVRVVSTKRLNAAAEN